MFCTQKILVVTHIRGGQCHDEIVPCPLSHQLCQFCQLTVLAKNTCLQKVFTMTLDKCALMGSHPYFFLNCLKICKSLCLSMHEYIGFKMYLWLLYVLACVGSCVLSCTCGGHRTALWSWFSPSLCGFQGLNSGYQPWVASFAHWAILPDHKLILKCLRRLKFVRVWIINQIF